jgi:hypothetical protein
MGIWGGSTALVGSFDSGEGDWVIDWLCEGRRRDEGKPNDDLRAQPDFFNWWIWLDDSARRVGQVAQNFTGFQEVAGGVKLGKWARFR